MKEKEIIVVLMLTFCDETKEAGLVFKQSFETRIPGEGELLQLRYIGASILRTDRRITPIHSI